jgi:hypothetical protein
VLLPLALSVLPPQFRLLADIGTDDAILSSYNLILGSVSHVIMLQ